MKRDMQRSTTPPAGKSALATLRDWHKQAQSTWYEVRWDFQAFASHVRAMAPDSPQAQAGGEDTAGKVHIDDLFLAGAAAHYEPEAWQLIEQKFGPRIIRALQSRRRLSEQRAEEAWSDTRTRLMEPIDRFDDNGQPMARIAHYRGNTPLFCYMMAAASNRMNDRIRRETVRHTQALPETAGGLADSRSVAPAMGMLEVETRRGFRDAMVDAYAKLTPRQQTILTMVFGEKHINQQDAAESLGTSPATVSREIQRAATTIRESMADIMERLDFTNGNGRAMTEVMGDCLRDWFFQFTKGRSRQVAVG